MTGHIQQIRRKFCFALIHNKNNRFTGQKQNTQGEVVAHDFNTSHQKEELRRLSMSMMPAWYT